MKPKLTIIIFNINLVLIFNLFLNYKNVNSHFASGLLNKFNNWHSTSSKSTSLINLQNNLSSLQRRAIDFSNRTASARSYASVARRLSQVGNHAAGIQEFGKLLQQLSQLDVNKLPLNAKLAKALQTLTKSKLLTGLNALNEIQERYGSNNQALAMGALNGNKTVIAAAALRTLLGTALAHARQSSSDHDSEKPNSPGSVFTNLIFGNLKDSKPDQPIYTIEDNSVSNTNTINTNLNPDYNTIKTWFLKLSQLALPDRQSTLADDPKQLNAALFSLINLARYFLCKLFLSLNLKIRHFKISSIFRSPFFFDTFKNHLYLKVV